MKLATEKKPSSMSSHIVGNKLIWSTPEDYKRIIKLKDNQLEVSKEEVPGNIIKLYDFFCNFIGI